MTTYNNTEPTNVGTDFNTAEPIGFGRDAFGSPTKDEFSRGFGDPETKYTAETNPATSYTADTNNVTEFFQMEPPGVGFGHAGSIRADGSIDEFSRGAGEAFTEFTEDNSA